MKVLVGITGASTASLGLKLYNLIPPNHKRYLILTQNAKTVLNKEENIFLEDDISAPPASGSFGIDVMFVVPCSINTLSKIALGLADNLLTRAAQVVIKEKKRLIIAPREMPLSSIHLKYMYELSKLENVIIAPPIFGYYSQKNSIEDLEYFLIGKWLDLAGIENNLYKRWSNEKSDISRDI